MAEIATTRKSTFTLSAPTSTRVETPSSSVEKNLARCVRRRVQAYSQLPVRCQRSSPYYRSPRAPFKLAGLSGINRTPSPFRISKSCPDSAPCASIFRALGTPRCKKSLSMIDLSNDSENLDLRSDSGSTMERMEDIGERMKELVGNDAAPNNANVGIRGWMEGFALPESDERESRFLQNPRKAASLMCRVLVLNAWRRRRAEIVYLRDTIDSLSQQVEHLHLQIVVLRRLLDTENNRVGKLTTDIRTAKAQFDGVSRERDTLKSEKEKLEDEVKCLAELSEERYVVTENLRNELLTAQNQVRAFDDQISRDREKLLKLREDKKMLLDKEKLILLNDSFLGSRETNLRGCIASFDAIAAIAFYEGMTQPFEVSASEAVAAERGSRAERAESAAEDLQLRLAAQIALVESSQEQIQRYSRELQTREEEKLKLEKRLKSTEEYAKSLNLRTVFLEGQLTDRESTLRRVESTCQSQLIEMNDMRDRLIRRSQENGWSSRMLQLAGSVVRAPRAIFRTLSLLSSTGQPLAS